MITDLYTKHTIFIATYTDNKLPYNIKEGRIFTKNNVFDLCLTDDKHTCAYKFSDRFIKILLHLKPELLTKSYCKINIIHDKTKGYSNPYIEKKEISSLTYECDARKTLAEVNSFKNSFLAHRLMLRNSGISEIKSTKYNLSLTTLLLLVLTFNEANDISAFKFLSPYSTNEVIKLLEQPSFKHYYKVIHPDTKIYHTIQKTGENND